jgi:protein TonB
MRRRGWLVAFAAGSVSLGLHASGLIALAPDPPETLAGGPAQLAMIGNSFEEAVAGTVTGSTDPVATPAAAPLTAAAETVSAIPVTPAVRPDSMAASSPTAPALSPPIPIERTTTPDADPAAPVSETAPILAGTPPVIAASPATAVRPTPTAPLATTPRAEMDTVAAREAPPVQTPDADTPRPMPRVARPAPTAVPRQELATPPPSAPAPQGNAPETTRTGTAEGAAQGTATQTQSGTGGQAASEGRAAAEYPQLVNRHLSRLRRPNTRFDGAAVIAFTIGSNGALAGLSVARSSGNAEFDRLALAHIQRAAPFPPPPTGAQRSYNVTVRGR